ncbi:MAG: STAS domain-containing protein [Prochlorothrix sp.]
MTLSLQTIQPSGIFDGTAAQSFHGDLAQALTHDPDAIVVDFRNTSFIDSSGLGALVSAQKKVRSQGKKLLFCHLNAQIKMIFELTSLDQAFAIFNDLEEVKQSLA